MKAQTSSESELKQTSTIKGKKQMYLSEVLGRQESIVFEDKEKERERKTSEIRKYKEN